MTQVDVLEGDRLKSGDQDPDLLVQLLEADGTAKDLSSGSPTVHFHMREAHSDTVEVDDDTGGNVSIDDPADGKVLYSWQSDDIDTPGAFVAEFEVVEGGEATTFPNDSNFDVIITEGIN